MAQAFAAYGKLVSGAVEEVGGWHCVREILVPARAGKTGLFGDCVAMVDGYELARKMAAAPDLIAALERCLEVFECSGMDGIPHSDARDMARQALRLAGTP